LRSVFVALLRELADRPQRLEPLPTAPLRLQLLLLSPLTLQVAEQRHPRRPQRFVLAAEALHQPRVDAKAPH